MYTQSRPPAFWVKICLGAEHWFHIHQSALGTHWNECCLDLSQNLQHFYVSLRSKRNSSIHNWHSDVTGLQHVKRAPRTKERFNLVFDRSKCITSCTWGVPAYWLIPCQVMGWTTASKWVTKLYTLQSACDNLPLYSYHGAYNWLEDIVECELNFSRAMLAADQINKQWEKAGQYSAKRLPLQIAQQFHDLKG